LPSCYLLLGTVPFTPALSAGIPRNSVTLGRPGTPGGNAGLAEAGSLQLEWFTLSARTKNQIYRQKALRVFDSIHKANPDQVQRAAIRRKYKYIETHKQVPVVTTAACVCCKSMVGSCKLPAASKSC